MRKKRLVVEVGDQAIIFGLVTSLKDYKLAWKINQVFKTHLVKKPELKIGFLNRPELSIINFDYQTENSRVRLIKNRSIEDITSSLIPEMARFDYFVLIIGQEYFMSISRFKALMKAIVGIDYVHLVDVEKLNSKDNFIF